MTIKIFSYGMFISILFMSQFYLYSLIKTQLNMEFDFAMFYSNSQFVLFWGAFFAINLIFILYEGAAKWKK